MSGQISDRFVFNHLEYDISAIEYPKNFFDINTLGLKLMPLSSICWRGYIATFALNNDNKLVLQKLRIKNNEEPPLINNKPPKIDNGLLIGNCCYDDIDLILDYTGSIIIGGVHIKEYCNFMGFEPPTHYELIVQLKFVNGTLEYAKDLSRKANKIREEKNIEKLEDTLKKRIETVGTEEHKKWIKSCFYLSFDEIVLLKEKLS